MLRRIRKILSILSLILALSIAILWLRSRRTPIHLSIENETAMTKDRELHRNFQFHSLDSGYISIGYVSAVVDYSFDRAERERLMKEFHGFINVSFGTRFFWPFFQVHAAPADKTFAGFSFDYGVEKTGRSRLTGKWISISLPHWFLILLLSLPGILHTAHRSKQRLRHRHGLCPSCGYDLRESKDKCPECGLTTSGATP
jgi:hypothetical protein